MTRKSLRCGIYQVLNTVTGKSYVGSSIDIGSRWQNHRWALENQRHESSKLQRSWNKHGSESWEWKILAECEEGRLTWLEAFWMDSLNSVRNGYNCVILTLEDGEVQRRHSVETREKISKAHTGKVMSEEQKEFLRNRVCSEETREEMRKAKLGRKCSEDTKHKMSQAKLGRTCTISHRRNVSLALKGKKLGRKHTASHCRNISLGLKGKTLGRKHTEEAKLKMSIGNQGKTHAEEAKRLIGLASKGRMFKDIQHAQRLAESKGGRCLSTIYLGSAGRLTWECSLGHTWDATPTNIQRGWCPLCARTKASETKRQKKLARLAP